MSYSEPPCEERISAARHQPRALRLVLLTMITVCGVLMVSITVSNPKIASTLNLTAQHVSYEAVEPSGRPGKAAPVLLLGLGEKEKRTSQNSSAQSTAAYKVMRAKTDYMPRDMVPVRRGGIMGGD